MLSFQHSPDGMSFSMDTLSKDGAIGFISCSNPISNGPDKAVACTPPSEPPLFPFNEVQAYNGSVVPPGSNVPANVPTIKLELESGGSEWTYTGCWTDGS
jgi:hypothetical protein